MIRMNNIAVLLFFITLITGCNAQSPKNKTVSEQELLKQELANQENARNGNTNPVIEIITDPKQVARLREYVIKKTTQRDAAAAAAAKNKTPWERYKLHDQSALPVLLSVLQGKDAKKRDAVYDGLKKGYEESDTSAVTDPALIKQLLKGIENPVDEEAAVQLAGYNQLPGYESSFEKRLLSGKSTGEGRIFFWLSHVGKSKPAFDYIETGIRTKRITGKNLDEAISGLEYYGQYGDDAFKSRVADLALFIYQNNLIAPNRFEDLKNSAYTSDAAETILKCLFEYGDKNVIPVADDILKRKIRVAGPVKALIRLDGAKHIDKIFAYLRNEDDFYTGLELVDELDNKLVTDDLLNEVLLQFSKRKDLEDYDVNRIVGLFTEKKALQYLQNPGLVINNEQLANRIIAMYKLSLVPDDEVLKDLLYFGIIEKMPDAKTIAKISAESKNNPGAFAWGIMEQQGVLFSFDTETDFVPADYDKLLLQFAGKSKGVLKDMLVWMDAKPDKNGDVFQYTITVVSNNKAFVTKPADIGDWYDIMTVNAMLDNVLTDLKSTQKFVSIDTHDQTAQYIFGDPGKINALVKKYKL